MTEEQALRRLAAMCSKAEHSSGEVDAKMRSWQMDDGARTRVAERLRSAGYVDDARFCRSFVHDKMEFDKWGRRKIETALYRKGVSRDIYAPVLDSISDSEYAEALRPMLEAKRRNTKARSDYELNAKLIKYALSRGYGMNIIRMCLDTDACPDADGSDEDFFLDFYAVSPTSSLRVSAPYAADVCRQTRTPSARAATCACRAPDTFPT